MDQKGVFRPLINRLDNQTYRPENISEVGSSSRVRESLAPGNVRDYEKEFFAQNSLFDNNDRYGRQNVLTGLPSLPQYNQEKTFSIQNPPFEPVSESVPTNIQQYIQSGPLSEKDIELVSQRFGIPGNKLHEYTLKPYHPPTTLEEFSRTDIPWDQIPRENLIQISGSVSDRKSLLSDISSRSGRLPKNLSELHAIGPQGLNKFNDDQLREIIGETGDLLDIMGMEDASDRKNLLRVLRINQATTVIDLQNLLSSGIQLSDQEQDFFKERFYDIDFETLTGIQASSDVPQINLSVSSFINPELVGLTPVQIQEYYRMSAFNNPDYTLIDPTVNWKAISPFLNSYQEYFDNPKITTMAISIARIVEHLQGKILNPKIDQLSRLPPHEVQQHLQQQLQKQIYTLEEQNQIIMTAAWMKYVGIPLPIFQPSLFYPELVYQLNTDFNTFEIQSDIKVISQTMEKAQMIINQQDTFKDVAQYLLDNFPTSPKDLKSIKWDLSQLRIYQRRGPSIGEAKAFVDNIYRLLTTNSSSIHELQRILDQEGLSTFGDRKQLEERLNNHYMGYVTSFEHDPVVDDYLKNIPQSIKGYRTGFSMLHPKVQITKAEEIKHSVVSHLQFIGQNQKARAIIQEQDPRVIVNVYNDLYHKSGPFQQPFDGQNLLAMSDEYNPFDQYSIDDVNKLIKDMIVDIFLLNQKELLNLGYAIMSAEKRGVLVNKNSIPDIQMYKFLRNKGPLKNLQKTKAQIQRLNSISEGVTDSDWNQTLDYILGKTNKQSINIRKALAAMFKSQLPMINNRMVSQCIENLQYNTNVFNMVDHLVKKGFDPDLLERKVVPEPQGISGVTEGQIQEFSSELWITKWKQMMRDSTMESIYTLLFEIEQYPKIYVPSDFDLLTNPKSKYRPKQNADVLIEGLRNIKMEKRYQPRTRL